MAKVKFGNIWLSNIELTGDEIREILIDYMDMIDITAYVASKEPSEILDEMEITDIRKYLGGKRWVNLSQE
jgi:hypothetical protein